MTPAVQNLLEEVGQLSPWQLLSSDADAHHNQKGVYLLLLAGRLRYIGQTSGLKYRLYKHRLDNRKFDALWFLPVDTEEAQLRVEGLLILGLLPPENRRIGLQLREGRITRIKGGMSYGSFRKQKYSFALDSSDFL